MGATSSMTEGRLNFHAGGDLSHEDVWSGRSVHSDCEGAREGGAGKSGPGSAGGKDGGAVEKASQCTMNFIGHKDYVLSVAISHDGKWVVSGSKDRGVQFWDANTAVAQCMLQGHKNSGRWLLAPSVFRFSVLFCMANVLRSAVISIDLSPAGNILATGSGDWTARICTSPFHPLTHHLRCMPILTPARFCRGVRDEPAVEARGPRHAWALV